MVGKAANLSDDQIDELAKLPVGVAAVYHNDWIEPVLCHFSKYEVKNIKDLYEDVQDTVPKNNGIDLVKYLVDYNAGRENADYNIEKVEHLVMNSKLKASLKVKVLEKFYNQKDIDNELLSDCIYNVFRGSEVFKKAVLAENLDIWNQMILSYFKLDKLNLNVEQQYDLLELLIRRKSIEENNDELKFRRWMELMGREIIR